MPVAAALACAVTLLMWRAIESKRRQSGPMWIPLPEEPSLRLRPDQVNYISTAGNYCELHTSNRVHLVRVPLKEMAVRLREHGFARVHRTALVNLNALESIERTSSGARPIARLRCGTTITVGRRFQADVLAATASC
jgi:two-component system LytT family response regulator